MKIRLIFTKELYPKAAIIKTAYHFTPDNYIHLDATSEYYIVELMSKKDASLDDIENSFKNELLAQTARLAVLERTANLRELIVARAFASTIVADEIKIAHDYEISDERLNDVLRDWYATNE